MIYTTKAGKEYDITWSHFHRLIKKGHDYWKINLKHEAQQHWGLSGFYKRKLDELVIPPPINTKMMLHIRFSYEKRGTRGYHNIWVEGIVKVVRFTKLQCESFADEASNKLRQKLYDKLETEDDPVAEALQLILEHPATKLMIIGKTFEDTTEDEGEEYEYVKWGR